MRVYILFIFAIATLTACYKDLNGEVLAVDSSGYRQFIIREGQHYCNYNQYKGVETNIFKFSVRFDSTAIYTTTKAENQYDINKLYGFSDNDGSHQKFSARFGWRWSDGHLRIFAYVYNDGERLSEEIGTVAIGSNINCTIKITQSSYIFNMDGKELIMPRSGKFIFARGYKLYPYFGGDEVAPHNINIWLKEIHN